MIESRRYLVTGGAGFIGSHIAAALLARGHEVVVLDDLSSGKQGNLEDAVDDAARAIEANSDTIGRLVASDLSPVDLAATSGMETLGSRRAMSETTLPADRLNFIEASILDDDKLSEAVKGVTAVFHQAAIPSVPRSFADPAATMRANAEGTTSVLEACRNAGVRRITIASSSSVYGDTPTLPKEESMVPNPLSPYALSKLAGEQMGDIFASAYGLNVIALRYFNVFGPRQDPASQYAAAGPKFITRMMVGKAPVIFGDGAQSRDFTFVDNVVAANLLAAGVDWPPEHAVYSGGGDTVHREGSKTGSEPDRDGGLCHVLNIGAGARHTVRDLVAAINSILRMDVAPGYTDPRQGEVRHSHASITKARLLLGYEPIVGFEEGLKRTVDWFFNHGVVDGT
ncbi:MAG: NAD-dependent epimerase/dehydratase family protein [Acidobacteriota bacterium]